MEHSFTVHSFKAPESLILDLEGLFLEFDIRVKTLCRTTQLGVEFQEKIDVEFPNGNIPLTPTKSIFAFSTPDQMLYVNPGCDLNFDSLRLLVINEWMLDSDCIPMARG
jgi:hypothetical protein